MVAIQKLAALNLSCLEKKIYDQSKIWILEDQVNQLTLTEKKRLNYLRFYDDR